MRCSAQTERATDDFTAAIEAGAAAGAGEVVFVAQAQLALLAARQGAWSEARAARAAAQALVEEAGLGDYSTSAIVHVATAASHCTRRNARTPARR